MNNKLKEFGVDALFEAVLTLETMEECYKFFEDLCTVQELKAISQRLQVAKTSIMCIRISWRQPAPALPPSAG